MIVGRRKAEAQEQATKDSMKETPHEDQLISQAFRDATAAFIPVALAFPQPAPPVPRPEPTSLRDPHASSALPLNLHELMTINTQTLSIRLSTPRFCARGPPDSARKMVLPAEFHESHDPAQICFPLTPDYYLLSLIQYNVLRAFMSNMSLCTPSEVDQSGGCRAMDHITIIPPPSSIPPAFYPTLLQRKVVHPFWIDSVPWAQMRDNLILAATGQGEREFDSDDLCRDMCGGLYDGFNDVESRGVLIWGEPWQPRGWEMTEGFIQKWSWLVRGCDELLEATNQWREERGEGRILLEID